MLHSRTGEGLPVLPRNQATEPAAISRVDFFVFAEPKMHFFRAAGHNKIAYCVLCKQANMASRTSHLLALYALYNTPDLHLPHTLTVHCTEALAASPVPVPGPSPVRI